MVLLWTISLNKKKEKRYLKENNVFEGGWMNVRRPAAKCTFMMLTSKLISRS